MVQRVRVVEQEALRTLEGMLERPRYDIVRRMRTLRRRADQLVSEYDWRPYEGRGYWHWKLPLLRHPLEGEGAREAVQAIVGQLLVDTAHRLVARRPSNLGFVKVVAIFDLPNMFGSEICMFFDEAYRAGFVDRQSDEETWTPARGSLAARWGLRAGKGFDEIGFDYVRRDFDSEPPWLQTGQVWMIGEL